MFVYCSGTTTGAFMPNKVHKLFLIGRISGTGRPQSVSLRISKI